MMKKINEYFFGESEVAVMDSILFYGFAIVAVSFCIMCGMVMITN